MNHISMSLLHKFIILAISIIGMVGFGLYIFDIDNAAWRLFAGTPLGLLCVIGVYEFIKKMYENDCKNNSRISNIHHSKIPYSRRTIACALIFAALLSFAFVLYSNETYRGGACLGNLKTYFAFVFIFPLVSMISAQCLHRFSLNTPPPEGSNTKQLSSKLECEKQAHSSSRINAIVELFLGNHTFIKIWLPVSVCWLVYLLLVWPGIWGADSIFQTQYLITGDKVWAHHPILHTLWLSLPMQISNALVGDYSPGFAFYTISQILATSAVMALILKRIRRWSIPQSIWIALFVTVCLFPGFATWSTMATKDILFAALFGLCIELIVDFWVLYPRCHIKPSKNDIILLWISFVLMLLLRNNAIYAFVLFSIPLVILSSKKWPAIIFSIALVLGCLGVNTALSLTLETKPGGQAEMMSVPACQLARVANNASNLTEEDARFIEDYVPSWRSYNESIADSVKNSFDMQRVKESPLGFLSGYLSIGLKYPDTFTDAFLKLSLGFWSPITNNNPYCPTGMWAPGENLPETDYIFIKHKEIIPGSLEAVNSLTKAHYEELVPGLATLFDTGTWVWLWVLYVFVCIVKRAWKWLLPAFFFFAYWLTILVGPVSIFRYTIVAFTCLPTLIGLLCLIRNKQDL